MKTLIGTGAALLALGLALLYWKHGAVERNVKEIAKRIKPEVAAELTGIYGRLSRGEEKVKDVVVNASHAHTRINELEVKVADVGEKGKTKIAKLENEVQSHVQGLVNGWEVTNERLRKLENRFSDHDQLKHGDGVTEGGDWQP